MQQETELRSALIPLPLKRGSTLRGYYGLDAELQADEAKWSDVMAAIRLAVQELRHEYGDDVTTVKVETTEMIPEWMAAVARMDDEQLEGVIRNMELVG